MSSHLEFVKERVIDQGRVKEKKIKKKNIVTKEVYLRCNLTRNEKLFQYNVSEESVIPLYTRL